MYIWSVYRNSSHNTSIIHRNLVKYPYFPCLVFLLPHILMFRVLRLATPWCTWRRSLQPPDTRGPRARGRGWWPTQTSGGAPPRTSRSSAPRPPPCRPPRPRSRPPHLKTRTLTWGKRRLTPWLTSTSWRLGAETAWRVLLTIWRFLTILTSPASRVLPTCRPRPSLGPCPQLSAYQMHPAQSRDHQTSRWVQIVAGLSQIQIKAHMEIAGQEEF